MINDLFEFWEPTSWDDNAWGLMVFTFDPAWAQGSNGTLGFTRGLK